MCGTLGVRGAIVKTRPAVEKNLKTMGFTIIRLGLASNLLMIGRLKFEDYEVENIRPLVRSSPPFARLLGKFGERRLARFIGVTEMIIGTLIAVKPLAPRAALLGSVAATAMFTTTLSFLVTTPEAWHQRSGEPKLSPAGQFIIKDIVFLGASLLTGAESLRCIARPHSGRRRNNDAAHAGT
jgi:uncharacterized membrane protein YkgB